MIICDKDLKTSAICPHYGRIEPGEFFCFAETIALQNKRGQNANYCDDNQEFVRLNAARSFKVDRIVSTDEFPSLSGHSYIFSRIRG